VKHNNATTGYPRELNYDIQNLERDRRCCVLLLNIKIYKQRSRITPGSRVKVFLAGTTGTHYHTM